ncbi:MAG: HIT family protein [Saprospiraceae bacterium]
MPTLFTRIVQGEIPCYRVAETEDYLAFLDVRPQAKGHTLCIPKREVDYIFDLADAELAGLMLFAKTVARALEQVVPCRRIGMAVIGLEVPHAHVHLIPLQSMQDITFGKEPLLLPAEEMQALAATIAAKIQAV